MLEFRLRRYGLGVRAVDGRFTRSTGVALRRYQSRRGLSPDGIAGPKTYRSLAGRTTPHAGCDEVARRPARRELLLDLRALPREPVATRATEPPFAHERDRPEPAPRASGWSAADGSAGRGPPASRDSIRAAIDYWSRVYGVDPTLARALAWMESGWQQDVVSSVGALGVMQLLPETWEFVDLVLLGERTPRTYQGNVRAGVRYLRWQLDEFGGDRRLALAGWYQGARAVREVGLYNETKVFVRIVLALYGTV